MSSNRASLLAGLRTGGVRSTSNPHHQVPHTAAPGGSFPRHTSANMSGYGYEDDNVDDELADMVSHQLHMGRNFGGPMTAGVVGSNNMFQQQQQAQMMMLQAHAQAQAAQLQMQGFGGNGNGMGVDQAKVMQMQMEMMKLQAMQQQQMMLAQVQMQQQQQQSHSPMRRRTLEPSTAGPLQTTFDTRGGPPTPLRSRTLDREALDEVPMTAALGGKFGSRSFPNGLNPNASSFMSRGSASGEDLHAAYASGPGAPVNTPATAQFTSVISGGTPLGNVNNFPGAVNVPVASIAPSKSDSAVSWRRGSAPVTSSPSPRPIAKTPSPPRRMPSFVISPPASESSQSRSSSPEDFNPVPAAKARPLPLRFAMNPAPFTASGDPFTESSDSSQVITMDSSIDDSVSTPTPTSSSSSHSAKEREEASKRLYEGLGIGRPVPGAAAVQAQNGLPTPIPPPRQASPMRVPSSQPVRQPRGPPGSADELGPKNFASRIRRKAIGGLGNLLDARERRESVWAVEAF